MKVEVITKNLEKLGHRIDEAGYRFFGEPKFVHAQGCNTIRLTRETVRAGNKHRATRFCHGCDRNDVIETFVVDRIF